MRALVALALSCLLLACGAGDDSIDPCGGCERGVCDTASLECVQPWQLTCPEKSDQCAQEQPYRCDSTDGPPSYDCAGCGCPGGATCAHAFCYAPETIALERFATSIPDDWSLDQYFGFVDRMTQAPAMRYQELVVELDARLRADARRAAILVGESHGSDDEQATGIGILRSLADLGWPVRSLGIEAGDGTTPILDPTPLASAISESHPFASDLTNGPHCSDALAGINGQTNDAGIYAQYSGSGHTSREVCHIVEHYPICELPHVSECVSASGYKAITLILFDPNIWMWQTDRVLAWRLGDLLADEPGLSAELDADIARWHQSFDSQVRDSDYDVSIEGRDLNVRIIEGAYGDDVFIAFFPRPSRPAYLLESYRALWNDAQIRSVITTYGMAPGNCSVSWDLTPGTERLYYWCTGGGYELTATIDGTTFSIVEWNAQPSAGVGVPAPRRRVSTGRKPLGY